MSDLKCPKCGADEEHNEGADTVFVCGSVMHGYGSEGGVQSRPCLSTERDNLKVRIAELEARAEAAEATMARVSGVFGECYRKNASGEMSAKESMKKCKRILSDTSAPIAVVDYGYFITKHGHITRHSGSVCGAETYREIRLIVMAKGGE